MTKFKASIFGSRPDKMITIKSVGAIRVETCQHRFDPRQKPRHANCEFCWKVYFHFHPMEVVTARSIVKMFGQSALTNKFGAKYAKAVKPFVADLEKKEEQEAHEEALDLVSAPVQEGNTIETQSQSEPLVSN